ncbi:MAG: citryl-CoA lyase [bacterium]|nr:citryl-CoA lyase [bacterium]
MKWKTALTTITDGVESIRGQALSDLIQKKSFVEVIYLLWTGKMPTENEIKMLNAFFVACIDHGVGAPSATVARTVVSTGNSTHTALSAGIAALGDLHGGAIEGAAKFFKEHAQEKNVAELIKTLKEKKIIIPGFGHKILEKDHRVSALFAIAKETGIYGAHCALAENVEITLNAISSKKLPLNIDGGMAAIILDMGFDVEIAKGFFMVGRVPGLIAHINEERISDKGLRRIDEGDIEYMP